MTYFLPSTRRFLVLDIQSTTDCKSAVSLAGGKNELDWLFLVKWDKTKTPKGPAQSVYSALVHCRVLTDFCGTLYITNTDQCERRFCTLQ